jgi:hypothetical protein
VAYSSGTIVPSIKIATVGGYDVGSGTGIDFGQDQGTYSSWVTGRIASPRTGSNWGGSLTFSTNDDSAEAALVERMRLDSRGNLGLGVTPSAWYSTIKAFQVGTGGLWSLTSGNNTTVGSNVYVEASAANSLYLTNGYATRYQQLDGQHRWSTAASGTAGDAISFTQAATLTADGNYVVGDTTSNFRIAAIVQGGANRDIFQAAISGYSNGLTIKWNHATSTTRVNITSIPTSSAGLSTGDLWNDGGTLKIA